MSRLTERSKYDRKKALCCTNVECTIQCGECEHMDKMMEKLADFEDKQEQGLLLILPCKVGDTVYLADKIRREVKVSIVEHVEYIVNTNANFPFTKIKGEGFCIFFDDFGKLAFLTRSEAEEALAKMGVANEDTD